MIKTCRTPRVCRTLGVLILSVLIQLTGCRPPALYPVGTPKSGGAAAPATSTVYVPAVVSPSPTPSSTAFPTATRLPTHTPAPTATPTLTLTPTPTPTAPPAVVRGDPLHALTARPAPVRGVPCGLVDTLDLPLDPPDAQNATGGQGFGRYSSRYGLYHAGEDWSYRGQSSSFGQPVYSIGHGVVTFAAPWGWGADQGTVIVRHTFADGSSVLSFYGHLDPPSVTLKVGSCVARGDPVGNIGRPRTSPHLHWEIRTHTPDAPGGGYTSKNPAQLGWLSPSRFVWLHRLAASPGVKWSQPLPDQRTNPIGLLDGQTFLVLRDRQLLGLDLDDGHVRWQQPSALYPHTALVHPDRATVYIASLLGSVEALAFSPAPGSASPLQLRWQIDLDAGSFPTLLPLPGGGVVVAARDQLTALAPDGQILWEQEATTWAADWVLAGERLILSTGSAIWTLTAEGAYPWQTTAGGHIAMAAGRIVAYDPQGVHRLDPETRTTTLWRPLDGGFRGYDDVLLLPDGGVILTYQDASNGSLIALAPDGSVRWQRDYSALLRGQKYLLALGGQVYLVTRHYVTVGELTVLQIDPADGSLLRLFVGGSRNPIAEDTWAMPAGSHRLMVSIGGTGLAALDLRTAAAAVQAAARAAR